MMLDCQPPSEEFKTLKAWFPACARSLGLSWTPSCVPLTKVVGRLFPLNNTCESLKKFVPVKAIVCPGLPACTLVGEMVRNIGMLEELGSKGLRIAAMAGGERACS